MKETLQRAIDFARTAHGDQTDKAGRPYMEHVLAVVAGCTDPRAKIVAALHDTIEDTPVTAADIAREFGDATAQAVDLLSKTDRSLAYDDYIERIADHAVAREVKIADLRHNMDLSRLPNVGEHDRRRNARYQRSLDKLLAAKAQN